MVDLFLAKENVESSNLFSRSIFNSDRYSTVAIFLLLELWHIIVGRSTPGIVGLGGPPAFPCQLAKSFLFDSISMFSETSEAQETSDER